MEKVAYTDEFAGWYGTLDEGEQDVVIRAVKRLEQLGVRLPFPYSSQIKGSKNALRELRVQSKGQPIRVIYAFNPNRQSVLILGGDKTGDDRFYKVMVPLADKIWDRYVEEEGWLAEESADGIDDD